MDVKNVKDNFKNMELVVVEKQSNIKRYAIVAGIVILCIAIYWFMLGFQDGTGNIDDIQDGLGKVEIEQQRAKDSIGRIQEGIERSESSVGRIESSIDRSEGIIRDIADGLERSSGQIDVVIERIEYAEDRNRNAEGRIGETSDRVDDGIRCADESESIFARYEKRN